MPPVHKPGKSLLVPLLTAAVAVMITAAAARGAQMDGTFEYGTEGTIWLVPHSHYDVAWLADEFSNASQIASVYHAHVNEAVLEPGYRFVLDQVPSIKTFLLMYPMAAFDLRDLVNQGRAQLVGGLYIQPDENLPEGETLLQNGVLGQRYLRETFGMESISGFNIDSFGHSWQMPQILQQVRIQEFAFARAGDTQRPPKSEFWWVAPDGSRVLTAWMVKGYDVAQKLGRSSDIEREAAALYDIYRELRNYSATNHVLIPVGGDYAAPPSKLVQIARYWNERHTDVKMNVATLSDFFTAVRQSNVALPEYHDESNRVFPGNYSARIWIKQRHRAAEHRLLQAERLATLASLVKDVSGNDFRFPADELEKAWLNLAINTFHDLLPATAVDGVYGEMEKRYEQTEAIAAQAATAATAALARAAGWVVADDREADPDRRTGPPALMLFNGLNWDRKELVRVFLPVAPDLLRSTPFRLVDESGKEVTYQVLERVNHFVDEFRVPAQERVWDPAAELVSNQSTGQPGVEIAFMAEVPAFGHRVYHFQWGISPSFSPWERELRPPEGEWELQTGTYVIKLDGNGNILEIRSATDGKVWIEHRSTTFMSEPLAGNQIIIATDNSNAYFHDGGSRTVATTLEAAGEGKAFQGPVMTRIVYHTRFDGSELVREIDLPEAGGRIDFVTSLDWRDRNKIIRVVMPTTGRGTTTYEIPYGFTSNRPVGQWPAVKWVDTSSERTGGVALLNRGLPDHEIYGGLYYLTLMRSIDYTFFRHGDSPNALGEGKHRFEYAIYPHAGTWDTAAVFRQAWEYNEPLLARWVEPAEDRANANARDGSPSHVSTMPTMPKSFLTTSSNLIVTALRRSGEAVLVRTVEALGQAGEARIACHWLQSWGAGTSRVVPVNALGRRVATSFRFDPGIGEVVWQARPQGIDTWLLESDSAPRQVNN
ncbi:MAG: hypothetical protein IMX00_01720 [Limnochordales bacterium]|nr:hypothetical protein [Limnochordales bacterium]